MSIGIIKMLNDKGFKMTTESHYKKMRAKGLRSVIIYLTEETYDKCKGIAGDQRRNIPDQIAVMVEDQAHTYDD